MKIIAQTLAITLLNLKTVRSRLGSSLIIVTGMACVTGVIISMLSLPASFMRAIETNRQPDRAIVTGADSPNEAASGLPHDTAAAVSDAPGLRRDEDGRPIASAEVLLGVPANRKP